MVGIPLDRARLLRRRAGQPGARRGSARPAGDALRQRRRAGHRHGGPFQMGPRRLARLGDLARRRQAGRRRRGAGDRQLHRPRARRAARPTRRPAADPAAACRAPTSSSNCENLGSDSPPLMISARKGDDFSFTLTTWGDGIRPYDFDLPYGWSEPAPIFHTDLRPHAAARRRDGAHEACLSRGRSPTGFRSGGALDGTLRASASRLGHQLRDAADARRRRHRRERMDRRPRAPEGRLRHHDRLDDPGCGPTATEDAAATGHLHQPVDPGRRISAADDARDRRPGRGPAVRPTPGAGRSLCRLSVRRRRAARAGSSCAPRSNDCTTGRTAGTAGRFGGERGARRHRAARR